MSIRLTPDGVYRYLPPARHKSCVLAYALWLGTGVFGGHNFYLGAPRTGLAHAGLALGAGAGLELLRLCSPGLAASALWFGLVVASAALGLWCLTDLLAISQQVRHANAWAELGQTGHALSATPGHS